MFEKWFKTFRRIFSIRRLGQPDDGALVVEQQQMQEFVELEQVEATGHGGGADFGLGFVKDG